MGRYDGYLLLSDFDNTLAHTEHEITQGGKRAIKTVSRENCDAIRYFQSEGGLFTLATGRPFHYLKQWERFFVPNTYAVSFNGAYICKPDGSDVLFSQAMDPDYLSLAKTIQTACPALEWVWFHSTEESIQLFRDEPLDSAPFIHPVYKMVFYAQREKSDEYAKRIASLLDSRYISMRSWINGIEVQMKGTCKGDAIPRLRERLGERARTVVAVGDYENDLDMILAADIGYAVENAVDALRAAADRVTVPCNRGAIARIIEELGR